MAYVLKEVGILDKVLHIIMESISYAKVNVLWNGQKGVYFESRKCIKKGELMSPYLFVLCMNKLSHMISDIVYDGSWVGIKAGNS